MSITAHNKSTTKLIKTRVKRKLVDEIGKSSIDSLKLRIPIEYCNSISDRLTENTLIVSEMTGEVIKANPAKLTENAGEIFIRQQRVFTAYREMTDCITMTIPAKALESKYFEGITINNFEMIYDKVQKSKVIDIDFEKMLQNGLVSDVDFKNDRYWGKEVSFSEWCKHCEKEAKPTKKIGRGCKAFGKKENQGIQFGTRATGTVAYPMFKVYSKHIDLTYKSASFASKHLKDIDYSNLIREETTARNSNFFNRILRNKSKVTLINLLNYSSSDLDKFISHARKIHIDHVSAVPRKKKLLLSGQKLMIYNAMVYMLRNGMELYEIENEMCKNSPNRMDKTRSKRLLMSLNDLYEDEKKSGLDVKKNSVA